MNTAQSILLIILTFFLGYIVGMAKDKKETFNAGVETGKIIASWDKEEPK